VIRGVDDFPMPVAASAPEPRSRRPAWRSLPIAPTALGDFAHCARRFELVHLLGLPERVRGTGGESARTAGPSLDARAQGTLAHAVLERLPASAIGRGDGAVEDASRALVAEGVAVDHPQHDAIVARVMRFVRSGYARAIAEANAELRREVAFVLGVDDEAGRTVTLRGSMDLVVVWPDGNVDIVDYKSARSGAEGAYAFQLDVYALAARAMFPASGRLRAGLVYLGGASSSGEPSWRSLPAESEVRTRIAAMGDRLVRARWGGSFARVALDRCEAIHCGFIGRCHASAAPDTSATESASNGTDAKPSRVTTT
jgi:hypothetical protein